jgi:LysM repeat protein
MSIVFRWKRIILLTALLLAGCYRQAAEPLEPINNPTSVPIVPDSNQITQPDSGDSLTAFPATATFPPITVIQATANPLATTPPVEQPQNTDIAPLTDGIATATPLIAPPPTPAAITPVSPGGPIVIDTATPTPDLLMTTTATPSGLITPTALFEPDDSCTYTVQTGDNLFRIAINHDISLDDLRLANPEVVGDTIQPGQVLQIPDCNTEAEPDVLPTAEPQITVVGGGRVHTVQSGETLGAIARQYGVTVDDIVQANNLANPNVLAVGQELKIP